MAEPATTLSEHTDRCPACGSRGHLAFELGPYRISDCDQCDHRFHAGAVGADHLSDVYGDDYFFGGGAGYDDYLTERDLLAAQGRRYGRLLARYAEPGRVLDVGSAAGFVSAGLRNAGWQVTGLEPNAAMVTHAKNELGLDAERGSLETAPDWPPFDAVCLIQVVGHFHDLSRAMAQVARLTKPGGLCLIEYWRRDSWIARLLGKRWHEYSPPSVLHWFTGPSLDLLMARNAFAPIASGAPKKYISGRHAKSLLIHKMAEIPLGRVVASLARLVPDGMRIRYPSFDLEWRLYRRDDGAEVSGESR